MTGCPNCSRTSRGERFALAVMAAPLHASTCTVQLHLSEGQTVAASEKIGSDRDEVDRQPLVAVVVDSQQHRRLVGIPRHQTQYDLDELRGREVRGEFVLQRVIEEGTEEKRLCQPDRGTLAGREPFVVRVVDRFDERLVEACFDGLWIAEVATDL